MPEITKGYGVNLRLDGEEILIAEKELPDIVEILLEDIVVAEATTYTTSVAIPFNRMYGVYVGTTGLLAGNSVRVAFSDNSPEGIKYSAEFTEALPEDVSQAWYFRDSLGDNNMNIEIENIGTGSATIDLGIKMEPF
jgi:hypothetical protein